MGERQQNKHGQSCDCGLGPVTLVSKHPPCPYGSAEIPAPPPWGNKKLEKLNLFLIYVGVGGGEWSLVNDFLDAGVYFCCEKHS